MRIASLKGRAAIVDGDVAHDLAVVSGGEFGADPSDLYGRWDALREWAAAAELGGGTPYKEADLGCPVPRPPQVFALAVNYQDHAAEASIEAPEHPLVFTKFPTSISGPFAPIELSTNRADWEVELVVVLGRPAWQVPVEEAWDHVAGLTVGQDISERRMQFRKPFPHLSVAKSLPGFGPIGPVVVTADELDDPDALHLSCSVNGELMQDGSTADLIFGVAALIAEISAAVKMLPGDLIFTGTPAGTGSTRDPRRYLEPGDVVESRIEGIGTIRNECVEAKR
ncbi:MAG: fumarylacetoacetate hydrolase family protein [Actinobacteria bacterium]|nr:fumarylacetoacetate hydrolase family protein [Actinomycetota bacterium]